MLRATDIEQLRVGKLSISTSLLVRAAARLGLTYTILPERTVLISDGLHAHYFRGTSLPCIDMVAAAISSNKYLSRKLLRAAGIPTPRTKALRNPTAWKQALNSRLRFPLVVKPVTAAHGRGATMNIQRVSEVRAAVERAFAFMKKSGGGNRVLVEEFFTGDDIRLFVVGNTVASAVHRVPAYVVGDGTSTITQLVRTYNNEWKSPIEFDYPQCPIPFDAEIGRFLRYKNRRLSDVPTKNEHVQLRWNANVSTGGRARDITDDIHPHLKTLAVHAAQILQLPIAGIDMLVKDIHDPRIDHNRVVILEANAGAGIDIHELPAEGTGRPVTNEILKYIYQPSAKKTAVNTAIQTHQKDLTTETYASPPRSRALSHT